MGRLYELAQVFRSKNAGPYQITLDIMFGSREEYELALQSGAITAGMIAGLYHVAEREVQIIPFPQAYAIKIVLPRAVSSGAPGDRDVYGAQQHGPLTPI